MKTLFHLFALLVVSATVASSRAAVTTGKAGDFFGPTKTHTFHLSIEAAEWDKMQPVNDDAMGRGGPGRGPMGGNGSERYPQGTATLEFDGKPWGDLKVRFKGNSSFNFARQTDKRSFKLDFDELDKNARFFGLAKLNLNNNAMDASGLRESLAYDVFRQAGIVVPRTALARVYLTVKGRFEREYLGAYTAIEQIDKTFLRDRFGQKEGLLLKPEQNARLSYLGDTWNAYARTMGEKSTATDAEGKRFVEFIRLLNQASDAEFAQQIGGYLDVDLFLRFVAVQAALVNYDSPLMSGHNYYLYLNSADHRFVWLPWDMNEAFGGFMSGPTPAEMSMRQPSSPGAFRLADRVLALEGSRQKFEAIIAGLLTNAFNAKRLGDEVARLSPLVREATAGDPLITLAEFERNVTAPAGPSPAPFGPGRGPGGPGMGPKPPLLQFINQRARSIADQLAGRSEGIQPTGRGFGGRGGPGNRGGPGGPGGPGGF